MPVIAVGLITDYDQAEGICEQGGCGYDRARPSCALRSALALARSGAPGAQVTAPNQYLRSQPSRYRDLFIEDGKGKKRE